MQDGIILYYLAAVLIRAAFIVLVLLIKYVLDINAFFSAPVKDTDYTVDHFNCDSFGLAGPSS